MKTKQTALEFLLAELDIAKLIQRENLTIASEVVRQAKAMEKEQIEKAFHHSIVAIVAGKFLSPEQYYNETYGTQLPEE